MIFISRLDIIDWNSGSLLEIFFNRQIELTGVSIFGSLSNIFLYLVSLLPPKKFLFLRNV